MQDILQQSPKINYLLAKLNNKIPKIVNISYEPNELNELNDSELTKLYDKLDDKINYLDIFISTYIDETKEKLELKKITEPSQNIFLNTYINDPLNLDFLTIN